MTDRHELRELTTTLAREAGLIALEGRRSLGVGSALGGRIDQATKSSVTDVVTEFDRAAEAHVVGELRRLRPDDAIVGEEGTDDEGTSGYAWFVDPIDGTTNFVYDQPAWTCSVAVAFDGEMLAGAVYAPRLDEMFSAALGAGATLNDGPISVTGTTDLAQALVATGFGYRPETRVDQVATLGRLIARVRDIRRLGSAAFDLCLVACGRVDAYYERHLNSWDAAAGELIAREAGAVTSDFSGGPARPAELVAAAPGIRDAFLAALGAD